MLLILVVVFSFFPINGQAATISDTNTVANTNTYPGEISVGFTSMGNISSLSFIVTGDYLAVAQGVTLNRAHDYRIDISSFEFSIYEDDILKFSTTQAILLKPVLTNTFIKFTKNGYVRQFSGSMTFKNNGSNFVPINTLSIEDYIKGVVPYEEGDSFPLEALKAQAVAARTYAISNYDKFVVSKGYNLTDDTNSQVYRGYDSNSVLSNQAVDGTAGLIITYNGKPIDATYSASNGGFTETPQAIGWSPLPYIPDRKQDMYDIHDIITYTPDQILQLLNSKLLSSLQLDNTVVMPSPIGTGQPGTGGGTIVPITNGAVTTTLSVTTSAAITTGNIVTTNNPNVATITIHYIDSNGSKLAYTMDNVMAKEFFKLVRSAWFTVALVDGNYKFNVRYGHGVGLSQWGSYQMAKVGLLYDAILKYYYSNITLTKISTTTTTTPTTPDVPDTTAKVVNRIGGQNRFETSIKIAENIYSGQVSNVVIASGYNFPDGLSGSVLASKVESPMLLVGSAPDAKDSSLALNYINTHLIKTGKIYILGGTGVMTSAFETKLTQMGYDPNNIVRLGGINRLQTSMKIAEQLNAAISTTIVISSQDAFPDALSISPIAARNGWPILLTAKDSLSDDLQDYILKVKPDMIYITGGTGVISDSVKNRIKGLLGYDDTKVVRLGGQDRYATSRVINSALIQNPGEFVISSGLNYPDALSGSVYAALKGAPILLSDTSKIAEALSYIKINNSTINFTILGLQGSVSDSEVTALTK